MSSSAPPLPSISFSLSFMSPLSLSHKLVDRRLHLGCCVVGALWVGPGPAHFQGTDVWLQGEEIENMERERKRKGTEGDALLGAEYEQKRNDWYSPCELCASSPKQLISMSSPLPPSLPPPSPLDPRRGHFSRFHDHDPGLPPLLPLPALGDWGGQHPRTRHSGQCGGRLLSV